ncbi:hypothetical protein A3A03_03985 [Candidatus Nomurabacteria bacterium RIFCSPLOWO2_01_FULL_40_18]|uniref:Uncharacterized protein n=1 Tax=Candidatus Nomurabacteria bacterium RIFCSPLOWO2_01_FULL_40_18 TaxID=1801773 RepID=A0A1F6XJU7_9BACT|nr:MAG: hypothetical protein A3A03_03985 [Candidatus Nomurabacteria bacterium RIFCSPLOWO2_01_FULL_40_18]
MSEKFDPKSKSESFENDMNMKIQRAFGARITHVGNDFSSIAGDAIGRDTNIWQASWERSEAMIDGVLLKASENGVVITPEGKEVRLGYLPSELVKKGANIDSKSFGPIRGFRTDGQ